MNFGLSKELALMKNKTPDFIIIIIYYNVHLPGLSVSFIDFGRGSPGYVCFFGL